MKTLKFKPHLVEPIISGAKTITWRLFDDKDLQAGDHLELINFEDGKKFAEAEIIGIREKKIDDLTDGDLKENNYINRDQVIELNKRYYGDGIGAETVAKIIEFKLLLASK